MLNVRLGIRALSCFAIWATILVWTLSYASGAGFGAATYRNECSTPRLGACPLVYHALLPPHVTLPTFVGNIFSLWIDGMYDMGLMVGLFLSIVLLFAASRMARYLVERLFYWPLVIAGCVLAWPIGYNYEIHRTLSSGVAGVPLL
ncbi:MAG: hypothetical protein WB438_13005 [Candidatus Cybelea sp.]